MTRDEAKKLAEHWVDTWRSSRHLTMREYGVEAFMACFDALTKGEADGYVAERKLDAFRAIWLDSIKIHDSIEAASDVVEAGDRIVPVKLLELEGSSK
jgi:hypothetical protein